eukprot:scaffold77_cov236-Pinguiococcus_pyrenoidosus.AAC.1
MCTHARPASVREGVPGAYAHRESCSAAVIGQAAEGQQLTFCALHSVTCACSSLPPKRTSALLRPSEAEASAVSEISAKCRAINQ